MAQNITMKNKMTNEVRQVPVGFSWTTLFFGIFVPLIRGDIKWFLILIVLAFVTFGFVWLLVPFFYNKLHVKDLIAKGWIPNDEYSAGVLKTKGIFFAEENA